MAGDARRRICIIAAALAAAAGACSHRLPTDPDPEAFAPHAFYRVEPIPRLASRVGYGPHDAAGIRGASLDGNAKVRLLVLGGSWVYGSGKSADEALPARLQQMIMKTEPSTSVGNAGCPGQCAAAAMLRLHFRLSELRPTHVLYVVSLEDRMVYGAEGFLPTLDHVPRPWTGVPWPAIAPKVSDEGAAALRRDLRSLAVVARVCGAKTIFAVPDGDAFADFRAALQNDAITSQGALVELSTQNEAGLQRLAHDIFKR